MVKHVKMEMRIEKHKIGNVAALEGFKVSAKMKIRE